MTATPTTLTDVRPQAGATGFADQLQVVMLAGRRVGIHCLPTLATRAGIDLDLVPFSGRVLIESLLRAGDEASAITLARRLAAGSPADREMDFRPARLLVQDYTGIPLLVDLAAVRDAVVVDGGRPELVNPAVPTDVVVDHSVQVDVAGRPDARARNESLELSRNRERYAFLKWAEQAFDNLRVFPPGAGIVHQVNIERLCTVVRREQGPAGPVAYPDTVIGTDSHTTMANGLGILGWGVGGLEAAAVMLGRAHPIAGPDRSWPFAWSARPGPASARRTWCSRSPPASARRGSSARCWSSPGPGWRGCPRRTVARSRTWPPNTAPWPPSSRSTRRPWATWRIPAGRASTSSSSPPTAGASACCNRPGAPEPRFCRLIEFDLGSVEATLAGPSHPHQRVSLDGLAASFTQALPDTARRVQRAGNRPHTPGGARGPLVDGDVVIAAITSCTSTSNPRAMLAAGLLAQRARRARPGRTRPRQDQLRARLPVRRPLPAGRRMAGCPGNPRISRGRFRVHDLQRRQRPTGARCRGVDRPARPHRLRGAQWQPELRGPDPSAGQGELPGLAGAGRGAGHHGSRPRRSAQRAAGPGSARRTRSPGRHLAR